MMKESTIRSPGLDEQQGCVPGPLEELQRSFEVSRVEVVAAALVRLWQDLGLGPDAVLAEA